MPLTPRTALLLGLGFALVAGLGTLRVGLMGDDHFQRAIVSGALPLFSQGPHDLYCFAVGDADRMRPAIEAGPFPWWTAPELKVHFFRPLSSLLLAADVWLFGAPTWPAHLHAVAWFLLLVFAGALVLRKVLPAPAAVVAVLLFALDDAHWIPVTWLANRHAVVSGALGLLGLYFHLRAREDGLRWGTALALLCFALSLAGGETALGALAYVGAYEVLAKSSTAGQRARRLAPFVGLGLVYVLLYRLGGYGAFGSPVYADPTSDTVTYLAEAGPRLLTLLGALTLGVPADAYIAHRQAWVVLSLLGVLGVGGWALVWRRVSLALSPAARHTAAWLALGTVGGLLPSLATFPADRMLFVPALGGAALLGLMAQGLWASATDGRLSVGAKALVGAAVVMHVVLPVLVWTVSPGAMSTADAAYESASLNPALDDEQMRGRVFLIAAPDFIAGLYPPLHRMEAGKGRAASWNTLSVAPAGHRLSRIDARTVDLVPTEGRFVETMWERLFHDTRRWPFVEGQTVRLSGATLTLHDVAGAVPGRLRLVFDDEVEAYTFVTWRDDVISPVTLPPIGETVEFPAQQSPFLRALRGGL